METTSRSTWHERLFQMVMEKTTESECTKKKGTGKDLFSWLVAMRSALQDFLVLHDLVGEGATRFGFDGRLGGCAWVSGLGLD